MIAHKLISRLLRASSRNYIKHQQAHKQNFLNNKSLIRHYSQSGSSAMKVTVLGAASNLGKSTALMLKQSPLIDELGLYDSKSLATFVEDLNFIDTKCKAFAYNGSKDIEKALKHSHVVLVIATGAPGESTNYNSIFDRNANVVKDLAAAVAKYSPKALVAIGTEPINSTVPLFSEIMKKHGSYNPYAIFGVTTLDVVRANKFVAEVLGLVPECVVVPIIGGHTEKTIVPVLSQATPCAEFTNEELEDITMSVKQANDNVFKASASYGAFLSNAFAMARFVISLVKALRGQNDIVECAYVKSPAHPQLKYMATPLLLGPVGVMKNLGIPELSDYETCLFENAVPFLIEDIRKGEISGGREDQTVCNVCDPNPNAPRCPPDHCEQKALLADK